MKVKKALETLKKSFKVKNMEKKRFFLLSMDAFSLFKKIIPTFKSRFTTFKRQKSGTEEVIFNHQFYLTIFKNNFPFLFILCVFDCAIRFIQL